MGAGGLLALPSWSDAFFWTPFLGLVPWIFLYGVRERRPPWLAFLAGAAVFWISYHRFSFEFGLWVPFATAAVFTPVFLVFPVALRLLRRSALPWTLLAPVAWVAAELACVNLSLGGVATILLGYTQARLLSLIQIADLGGVYLVSFVIAMVNGAIVDALRAFSSAAAVPSRRRRALAAPLVAALVLLAANLYGLWRLRAITTEPGPRVGIVQPAVGHTGSNVFGAYGPAFFLTAQAWSEPGEVDLIVWPESAIQDTLDRFALFRTDLAWLARRSGAPLLVGAFGWHPRTPAAPTNSAFLVDASGLPVGRYDKIRLMPWMEYLPFSRLLGRIDRDLPKRYGRLLEQLVGARTSGRLESRGVGVELFRFPGLPPFAVLICFETMDPALARTAARRGARFLVNPTSEGIAGTALQLQMLRISALRAVETRLTLVRAGNQGISGFVGPRGELQQLLRGMHTGAYTQEPGIAVERVRLTRASSFYVRAGDLFAWLNAAALVGGLLWAAARRR